MLLVNFTTDVKIATRRSTEPGIQQNINAESGIVTIAKIILTKIINATCKPSTLKRKLKLIFFDFEYMQDDVLQCEEGYLHDENKTCRRCGKSWCGSCEHRPNLCVANKVCDLCTRGDHGECMQHQQEQMSSLPFTKNDSRIVFFKTCSFIHMFRAKVEIVGGRYSKPVWQAY